MPQVGSKFEAYHANRYFQPTALQDIRFRIDTHLALKCMGAIKVHGIIHYRDPAIQVSC